MHVPEDHRDYRECTVGCLYLLGPIGVVLHKGYVSGPIFPFTKCCQNFLVHGVQMGTFEELVGGGVKAWFP